MKKEGSLKIVLSVLVIVLITLISMWGIYVKSGSNLKNILPDYEYGMELKNTNIINLEVVKEESSEETNEETNTEEITDATQNSEATIENAEPVATSQEESKPSEDQSQKKEEKDKKKDYTKAKQIIEKRLKIIDINQYTIRLDESTGNMAIEVPTEVASIVSQNEFSKGKFEIKIKDNDEVIIDNKGVQDVKASINNQYANMNGYGSIVELSFVFNKDAIKKFTDIKNNYELTYIEKSSDESGEANTDSAINGEENAETSNTEGISKDREVSLNLDGTAIYTTNLEEFLKYAVTGTLPLSLGGYTNDSKALESSLQQANITKSLILTENLPVEYTSSTTSNIHSNINKNSILIVFAVLVGAMVLYLIIKYKLKGLLGGLTILGVASALLLIVRFSNVVLTISSIFAIGVVMILQFIYLIKLLNGKTNSKQFNDNTFRFIKMLIPVFLMSIAISFAKVTELIGFGEVTFWGIIVFAIFNNIITRAMLTNVEKNN